MQDVYDELRRIHHDLRHARLHVLEILAQPHYELEEIMAALDDLNAANESLDASIAALPGAVAASNAAAVAASEAAFQTAASATAAKAAALAAEIANLSNGSSTGGGGTPASMTVSPTTADFSIAAGASSAPLTITGGTAPLSASGLPEGVLFDGVNLNFAPDGNTVAGTSTVTISDSSTPPLTADVSVVIA